MTAEACMSHASGVGLQYAGDSITV